MSSIDQVEELVRIICPAYCDVAGDENTTDIIRAVAAGEDTRFESLSGGSDFDMHLALDVVLKTVTFVNACLGIVKSWHELKNMRPTPTQLLDEAKKQGAVLPSDLDQKRAVESVLAKSS